MPIRAVPASVGSVQTGAEGAFERLVFPVGIVVAHEAEAAFSQVGIDAERIFRAGDGVERSVSMPVPLIGRQHEHDAAHRAESWPNVANGLLTNQELGGTHVQKAERLPKLVTLWK